MTETARKQEQEMQQLEELTEQLLLGMTGNQGSMERQRITRPRFSSTVHKVWGEQDRLSSQRPILDGLSSPGPSSKGKDESQVVQVRLCRSFAGKFPFPVFIVK